MVSTDLTIPTVIGIKSGMMAIRTWATILVGLECEIVALVDHSLP